jgi:acetyl-CoA carboxylase biotin carboxyl carrier protein
MPIGQDGLRQVLDAFEVEEWDEIHLVTGDVEVHLIARGAPPAPGDTSHVSIDSSVAADTVERGNAPTTTDPGGSPGVSRPIPGPAAAREAGTELVVAPSPGIVWRAPSPGAPPFTDVGERVEPGTALCIVEVMKLMNTLPSPLAGTVVEVCAQNGQQVETGQPLFRIRPEGR